MIRKNVVIFLVVLLAFSATGEARTLIGGRGIPVVSDPRDLNLVNLKNLSEFLYSDLKEKGEFGFVRRVAVGVKAKQLGIPNPRKKILHAGFVVGKGDSGHSSAILVMTGDIKFKNIRAALEKDYREYMEVNKGTANIGQKEVAGIVFDTFAYSEQPYETCIAQIQDKKAIIIGAIRKDDTKLLEETVKVVLGQEPLNEAEPSEIDAETTFTLTQRERERLVRFNQPKGQLRAKFAKDMHTLARKLGIPSSDDETVPLDQRIRGQIGLSNQISVKYHWDVDSRKAAAYSVQYDISMPDRDKAEKLRDLIAEQIVRLAESARNPGERESLGRLTVATNENKVQVQFLLDSPEAQFQHTSLVLGQALRYKSLFSFIHRLGQGITNFVED